MRNINKGEPHGAIQEFLRQQEWTMSQNHHRIPLRARAPLFSRTS